MMMYVDSWIREAHAEAQGESVNEQLLGELSQVFRSAKGRDIFVQVTGISINSKAEVLALLQRVKNNDYNLQAALRHEQLSTYVQRTSSFNID